MANARFLTAFDDYFIHQLDEPLVTVDEDDARWMDRGNFWAFDDAGSCCLMLGLGTWANARLMDGFACLVVDDVQHNLRVSRHMSGDRANTRVGPLSYQVLDPLRRWRLELAPNEMGVACALDFEAQAAPYLMDKQVMTHEEGRPPLGQSHFVQFGHYTGWIEVAGKRIEGDFIGLRDRTWGVRSVSRPKTSIHLWLQCALPDLILSLWHQETRDGAVAFSEGQVQYASGQVVPVTGVRHRLHFDGSVEHASGEVQLELANGQQLELSARRLLRGVHAAGGGYAGWQGVSHGDLHQEGEAWHLPALTVESLPLRWYDQIARYTIGDQMATGIFEVGLPRNPAHQYQATF